jgi:hypothetical protein
LLTTAIPAIPIVESRLFSTTAGEKFVADLILVDQCAKKHIAKKVEFHISQSSGKEVSFR